MSTKPQLELTFDQNRSFRSRSHRQRRIRRAQWWFEQMRQVVDRALDRRPGPIPPPEQIYMTLQRNY